MGDQWSSLEVARLLVGVLTPTAVVALGWWVTRATRRLEEAQWLNRTLIERRLALYDDLAPGLNDIYCVFMCVGHFREIAPPSVIVTKRDLDKTFFVNRFLFSEHVGEAYDAWNDLCFKHFARTGRDAPIRASAQRQRLERGEAWDAAWECCFVEDGQDVSAPALVRSGYRDLMHALAEDIGVGVRVQGDSSVTTPDERPAASPRSG